MTGIAFLFFTFSTGSINPKGGQGVNTWWARGGSCSWANLLQMSLFAAASDLLTLEEGRLCPQTCAASTDALSGISFPQQFSWTCVVTFYFTVKAVSVLLRGWLLVGFLVVLLGTLAVVVHPLNSILLHGNTKAFILKRTKNASGSKKIWEEWKRTICLNRNLDFIWTYSELHATRVHFFI